MVHVFNSRNQVKKTILFTAHAMWIVLYRGTYACCILGKIKLWKINCPGQVLLSQFSIRVALQPREASQISLALHQWTPNPLGLLSEALLSSGGLLKQTHFLTQFLVWPNSQHGGKFSVGQYPTLAAVEGSRRSTFTTNMGSSGASTLPIRETIAGEVLPLVTVDEPLVAVKDTWDLDSALNASTQAPGVFNMPIPTNIDPKGDYAVRTDFPPAPSPPIAIPTTRLVVPEPVAILIVQGDMKIHHARSLEEPPAPFLEGEDVDDVESDEDQAGVSTPPELPRKRARMVTAGKLATLGLADEGFTFASVLESHVPAGPAKK